MKRLFDIIVSLIILSVFSPIMCIIAILVKLQMGSPVFLKQMRPGIHGTPFCLYKFRTMANVFDDKGNLLSDEIRLTDLGKILRKYSLDELPQFINVLKGEMSLVGPRPLLMDYLPLYTKEQAKRHNVKPGITGMAQINGRNALAWEEKFKLDNWYVENKSFLLDLKIIGITFMKVVKKEGINHEGYVSMQKFTGSKDVSM